jgi:hypothetical protein
MQLSDFDWEFGLQQRVAAVSDRFVRCKPVQPFSPGIPEFDRPIELPRKHRLVGQLKQVG